MLARCRTWARADGAPPRRSHPPQNLIRPVESRDPHAQKISLPASINSAAITILGRYTDGVLFRNYNIDNHHISHIQDSNAGYEITSEESLISDTFKESILHQRHGYINIVTRLLKKRIFAIALTLQTKLSQSKWSWTRAEPSILDLRQNKLVMCQWQNVRYCAASQMSRFKSIKN